MIFSTSSGIYLLILATGKIHIAASADGEIGGVWEKILGALIVEPDFEWLLIDASHCKVHPHAAGAAGDNEAMSRTKGGSTQKIYLAVDVHGMPVRVVITEGTRADCKEA